MQARAGLASDVYSEAPFEGIRAVFLKQSNSAHDFAQAFLYWVFL